MIPHRMSPLQTADRKKPSPIIERAHCGSLRWDSTVSLADGSLSSECFIMGQNPLNLLFPMSKSAGRSPVPNERRPDELREAQASSSGSRDRALRLQNRK